MQLWGGRFSKETADLVKQINASIEFDRRLYHQDILGSLAHSKMLAKQGIIREDEAREIGEGLRAVLAEIERGDFEWSLALEDIHLNVEGRLHALIGDVAGKLHTARSRNDQIALDMRLFARDAILDTIDAIVTLGRAMIALAQRYPDLPMPGFTHLQHAQPVLWAHHMLAYIEMLLRDAGRLQDCYKRTNLLPLGAGALAGVTFPIDREYVAELLGFAGVLRNSMDAVADRDFVVEYEAAAALVAVHLSRMAEELIIWSTSEWAYVEIDDAYATGSSIMPQKKNPDVAELLRGKTGRVFGNLMALLTTLKGLPLAYNKDMQEDKEGYFDTVDTILISLRVMAPMLATLRVREERLRVMAGAGYALATDYADYLVRKGLPFRAAHEVVGRMVAACVARDIELNELSLDELRTFNDHFEADAAGIDVPAALAARSATGGTAPDRVRENLGAAETDLNRIAAWSNDLRTAWNARADTLLRGAGS